MSIKNIDSDATFCSEIEGTSRSNAISKMKASQRSNKQQQSEKNCTSSSQPIETNHRYNTRRSQRLSLSQGTKDEKVETFDMAKDLAKLRERLRKIHEKLKHSQITPIETQKMENELIQMIDKFDDRNSKMFIKASFTMIEQKKKDNDRIVYRTAQTDPKPAVVKRTRAMKRKREKKKEQSQVTEKSSTNEQIAESSKILNQSVNLFNKEQAQPYLAEINDKINSLADVQKTIDNVLKKNTKDKASQVMSESLFSNTESQNAPPNFSESLFSDTEPQNMQPNVSKSLLTNTESKNKQQNYSKSLFSDSEPQNAPPNYSESLFSDDEPQNAQVNNSMSLFSEPEITEPRKRSTNSFFFDSQLHQTNNYGQIHQKPSISDKFSFGSLIDDILPLTNKIKMENRQPENKFFYDFISPPQSDMDQSICGNSMENRSLTNFFDSPPQSDYEQCGQNINNDIMEFDDTNVQRNDDNFMEIDDPNVPLLFSEQHLILLSNYLQIDQIALKEAIIHTYDEIQMKSVETNRDPEYDADYSYVSDSEYTEVLPKTTRTKRYSKYLKK